MSKSARLAIMAVTLLVTPTLAFADDMAMPGGDTHSGGVDQALMQSMQSMNKGMAAPMTGNPDKDFVTMMLPHHEGAVAMAKVELQYGTDPHLRALAKSIVASQGKEIATMKQWQGAHTP